MMVEDAVNLTSKMKKFFLFFLFLSSISFSQVNLEKLLNKWNKGNVPYISVEKLASLESTVIILDARERREYNVSHIKNAFFVGYEKFNLKDVKKILPQNKNKKIIVYCSLGIRSETVADKLINAGYTNVYNLYGGIFEWKNKNFQIIDSLGKPTENVHTVDRNWSKLLTKGQKIYE